MICDSGRIVTGEADVVDTAAEFDPHAVSDPRTATANRMRFIRADPTLSRMTFAAVTLLELHALAERLGVSMTVLVEAIAASELGEGDER